MSGKLLTLTLFCTAPAWGWGRLGHEMSARVAVRALPSEMPGFFREAIEELAYLCPEPDRWRDTLKSPALTALTAPDHWMKMENVPAGLPGTRYEFVLANVGRKNQAGRALAVQDLGTGVYAMAEFAEMLTVGFRLWRRAPSATPAEQRLRRQMEQNIIHAAGVLAHWVTDTAQPLHASVHISGWHNEWPNPRQFEGKGIHGRFESTYVDANIREPDIAARVGDARALGVWIEEAERHLRSSNSFVERVYVLDQQASFGSGKEPPEAKELTAARLGAGAQALRDFWYSAWKKSE